MGTVNCHGTTTQFAGGSAESVIHSNGWPDAATRLTAHRDPADYANVTILLSTATRAYRISICVCVCVCSFTEKVWITYVTTLQTQKKFISLSPSLKRFWSAGIPNYHGLQSLQSRRPVCHYTCTLRCTETSRNAVNFCFGN